MVDGLAISLFSERLKLSASLEPLGGDSDDLFMESACAVAVECEPAEGDHSSESILWILDNGDPREVVGCVALSDETTKDSLNEGMAQVKMNQVRGHRARRFEDDGQRRLVAPLPETLVSLAGRTQRV